MANPSKDAGTKWETAIVRWLQEHGFPDAQRRTLGGKYDPGDIEPVPATVPPVIVSAKWGYGKDVHPQTVMFQKWWRELKETVDRRTDGDGVGLLCHHRSGKASPEFAHWYVDDRWHDGPIKITGPMALFAIDRAVRHWQSMTAPVEDYFLE